MIIAIKEALFISVQLQPQIFLFATFTVLFFMNEIGLFSL